MSNRITKSSSFKLFNLIMSYFLLVLILFTCFKIIKIKNCLILVQVLSVIIPVIVYLVFTKDNKKNIFINLGVYLFLILILPFVFSRTYDYTVDGNSYHKTAIGFIKDGWNPIYESCLDFQKYNDVPQIDEKTKMNKWIDHYPKATWILSATMYKMTDNIESGKCINLILIVALILLAYSVMQTIFSKKLSFLLSVLIAINPINLSQLFSYYLDGIMGICFFCEVIILLLVNPMEKTDKKLWLSLTSICAIFVNLKYTGLLYSGIIAAIFYFYWIIKYRKQKDFGKCFKRFTLNFVIVFSIAIFLVGSTSYVKNTITNKNPLYPIIGQDKIDIITEMQPKVFNEISMGKKFVWSLFSKTENVTYSSGAPELKLPFIVYKTELDQLSLPDVRIGGFGPLFALSFIIGIIYLIIGIIVLRKKSKVEGKYIFIPLICIIITCIFGLESWWARYIPQLYYIPVMSIILFFYLRKYGHAKKYNLFAIILIAILSLNSCFYISKYKESFKAFKATREELIEMSNLEISKIQLTQVGTYGLYYNLKDYNVNYTTVKINEDQKYRYIFSWKVMVEENE